MLQHIVSTICEHTKWNMPTKKENGEYCFLLDESTEFSLFSPNGQDIIFYVNIADIPADNTAETFLKTIARKSAGMYKMKKSVISAKDNQIILHRILDKSSLNSGIIIKAAKDLLNEADIWHTALKENSASPFSFSFGGIKF